MRGPPALIYEAAERSSFLGYDPIRWAVPVAACRNKKRNILRSAVSFRTGSAASRYRGLRSSYQRGVSMPAGGAAIRPAGPSDADVIIEILASGFQSDPPLQWLLPDASDRLRLSR